MEGEARALLVEAGADPSELTLRRTADMRYVGQGFEIPVPLPEGPLGSNSLDDLKERFLATYAQLFERRITDMPIEAMSWRLSATAPVPNVELNFGGQPARQGDARKGTRQVYFPQTGFAPCAVYDRYSLIAGTQLAGPAVIEERESTIVAGPDARITVDKHLNVVMEID
jgi:N-methylhydantoinase A